MRKKITFIFLGLSMIGGLYAQQRVKGTVTEADSEKALSGVIVSIQGSENKQLTGVYGEFVLNNVNQGAQVLQLSLEGFETFYYPINIEIGKELDLGILAMYPVFKSDFDSLTSNPFTLSVAW